jgi:hypothetical protein
MWLVCIFCIRNFVSSGKDMLINFKLAKIRVGTETCFKA